MAYWWVNHKQTYKSEIEGGYIWSPKKNADGSKNQTYLNLTLTRPGDFVISYAGSEIRAIGVVASSCREQPKPSAYLKKSDGWATVGWAVPIDWEVLVCPVKPKENITKIAPLLPKKYSPLQSNGNGNQSCYLASISDDLGELIVDLSGSMNRESIAVVYEDKIVIEEEVIVKELASSDIEPTEKEQIIKARIGQGKFRKNVEKIESRCRVTLVSTKDLLVASLDFLRKRLNDY